jgi:beta-mannosidase
MVDDPAKLDSLDLDWVPFTGPGTVAAALADAGRWSMDDGRDLDGPDWWFRCSFPGPADSIRAHELCFDGLATLADVWLNGTLILSSANMFRAHRVAVSALLEADNELVIRCASLTAALGAKRPRPGWKTNLVDHQNLRWFRTTLHGRRPTWTGACAPVGPWRPVTLAPVPPLRLADVALDARPMTGGGRLEVAFDLENPAVESVELVVDGQRAPLARVGRAESSRWAGSLVVEGAEPWWPATHGAQPRYPAFVEVTVDGVVATLPLGSIGFRSVAFGPAEAPVLAINDQPVFVRGAVWVPADPLGLAPSDDQLRTELTHLRDAGMNMVRVPGTATYESTAFFEACDELGLMVWHDLMFARMDYPMDDDDFRAEAEAEVDEFAARLVGHPSVVVVCGGSEIGQQAAMVGRPADSDELIGARVADVVAAHLPHTPYVVDVPIGGTHPFTVDHGIANYFGVGGYRRPVNDARLCGVRFASECLAFSNVPGEAVIDQLAATGVVVGDPGWKRGLPRDRGASWDFEDVRDHYAAEVYGVDPTVIRATDPERYLDLGRAVGASVMAEVFRQWRRPDSGCAGALVLESRDCRPGAGPGLLDAAGSPKVALAALASVLAPVALLACDEGMNGLDVWAVNDTAVEVSGVLSVAVYGGDACVGRADHHLSVGPRSHRRRPVEELLDGFLDLTYAYRFGPQPLTCVVLHWRDGDQLLARATFAPGRPAMGRSHVGLAGHAVAMGEDSWQLTVSTEHYAHFVQIEARGAQLSDNGFDLEPGGSFTTQVTGRGPLRARVRALNAHDSIPIKTEHG